MVVSRKLPEVSAAATDRIGQGLLMLAFIGTFVGASSLGPAGQPQSADAHFFGVIQNVDNYQIVFQPYPFPPVDGENSTLNFSILKDNYNINNVYVALIIKDKKANVIVDQFPYKFYEFSDITIPYRFKNATDYVVLFNARINGDSKYQGTPLVANFDVSAVDQNQPSIPFDKLMLYYVTPASAAVAGLAMYMRSRTKTD